MKLQYKIIAFILFCFTGTVFFQGLAERELKKKENVKIRFIPNAGYFKNAIRGYEEFEADIYWIKAVIYFGGITVDTDYTVLSSFIETKQDIEKWKLERLQSVSRRLSYLYNYIDLITELDPYFFFPYNFAGLFLATKLGEFDRAIEILEKGERTFPQSWRLSYIKGFTYFFYKDNVDKALVFLQEASQKPECPFFVANLAYAIMNKVGKKDLAIGFLTTLKGKKAESEWNKEIDKMIEELKGEIR